MINHHVIKSAAHAENYFKESLADGRAEYYKEEEAPERWGGKGAELTGLKIGDSVDSGDFRRVFNGRLENPETGESQQLGNNQGVHRPGIDLPIAAPKSVSIVALVGGDERVTDAHRAAADRAMAYLESKAGTRVREGGKIAEKATGNLIYAAFDHETSRALDPHLHTHYVVANATFDTESGKWRSLNFDSLVREAKAADAIYKNELARELTALGYQVEWTKNGPEIKGISREQIEVFSKRTAQVDKVLEEKNLTRETASGSERNVAALTDRNSKVHAPQEELHPRWQEEAKAVGLDVKTLVEAATHRQSTNQVPQLDDVREAKKALANAIAHLGEREAAFTRRDLMEAANRFAIGRTTASHIELAVVQAEKDGVLIRKHDTIEGKSGEKLELLTTKSAVKLERDAVQMIREGKGASEMVASFKSVQAAIDEFEKQKGFALNEGQRNAAVKLLTSYDRSFAVQGYAGTGKTTMLEAVRDVAEASGWKVVGMSPYAAQAAVLEAESGIKSVTVASFLKNQQTRAPATGQEGQGANKPLAESPQIDHAAITKARVATARKEMRSELNRLDWRNDHLAKPKKDVWARDIDAWGVVPKGRYLFTKDGTFMAETGAGAFLNQAAFALRDKFRDQRLAAEKSNSPFKALGNHFMEKAASSLVQWRKVDPLTAGLARGVAAMAERREMASNSKRINELAAKLYDKGADVSKTEQAQISKAKSAGLLDWSPSVMNHGPAPGTRNPPVIPPAANDQSASKKEIWVVDEASLLTQKELNSLLKLAKAEGVKVVFTGDLAQHQSVGAGAAKDVLHQAGVASATLTEVRRQEKSNEKGRQAYAALKPNIRFHDETGLKLVKDKGSASEALDLLVKGGKGPNTLVEKSNNDELIGEIAQHYVKDGPQDTVVVTATNRDRHSINEAIRSELKAHGHLADGGVKITSLERLGITQAEGRFAHSYDAEEIYKKIGMEKGKIVIEAGRNYKSMGVKKGEQLTVVGLDAHKNTVILQKSDGTQVVWNPQREKKMNAFKSHEIELSVGDHVRFTKNDKDLGVVNGLRGTVLRIEGGKVTIDTARGERVIEAKALMHHLGHAYATTSYGAQGKTTEKAIYHINTISKHGVGQRSFYIAITRAKKITKVFTTSIQSARKLVETAQDKTTALDKKEFERQLNEEASVAPEAGKATSVKTGTGRGR